MKTTYERPLFLYGLCMLVCLSLGLPAGAVEGVPAELGPISRVEAGGSFVQTSSGAGWHAARGGDTVGSQGYLEVDPAAISAAAEAGQMSFVLQRGEEAEVEALFSLLGDDGFAYLVLQVFWSGHSVPGRPEIVWYNSTAAQLWQPPSSPGGTGTANLPFPMPVLRGQEVRITLNWADHADANTIHIDGERIATSPRDGFGFPDLLRRADRMVVGVDISRPAGKYFSQLASTLTHFSLNPVGMPVLVGSVASDRAVYGIGQEVVVSLRGRSNGTATFTINGVATEVAMTEVDDGVYVGQVAVPAGVDLAAAALTGTLTDPATGESVTRSGRSVALDSTPPEAPARFLVTAPWAGEIELTWTASASADLDHYLVFRGEGKAPDLTGAPLEELRELTLVDTRVIPGLTYHYAVVAVDKAGNRSVPSEPVSVTAVAGDGPAISSIRLEPFGRPLRPGQSVTLAVAGQSGGTLTVDLGELGTGLALVEQGRTGVYLGTYTVGQADVGPTRGLHRVVAHLADLYGSSSLAGPELAVVGLDVLNDVTSPTISKASHDGFAVAGFSGKLVAGDVLTVTLEGEPAGYASFAIPGVVSSAPMSESEARPGTYIGTYTVGWSDEGRDVALLVTLADEAGNETTATAGRPVSFDTRVRLLVSARDSLLPADRQATTRLVAKATNANGDEVSGHELALTLSTTEEYTGVVGGGRLEDRTATKDDVDNVEVRWGGVTDSFGEVAATYTAGFAAKTALLFAKNLTTGDVGAGWLNTYVASTVSIELLPRAARGAADRAILRLIADPEWLTADGRSTSRIKAFLTDLSGNPMVGQRVTFALGNDNGRLRVLRSGLTDEQGVAEAEYRAGTLAGFVTLTAASRENGVTAAVQLELRADAPAKIDLAASAPKLVAGDKATLSVTVTDIHDNPNIGVPVTFALLQGSGTLAAPSLLTDRNGQGGVAFTAGSSPGIAVIEARHTSRAPTEDELRRVYGTVFVPRLAPRQERDRVRVVEWLVKPRAEVAKGQPLVTLEGGNGTWTLAAPEKGVFVREVKHKRDRVELGDTLGYVEIDAKVWKEEYGR